MMDAADGSGDDQAASVAVAIGISGTAPGVRDLGCEVEDGHSATRLLAAS